MGRERGCRSGFVDGDVVNGGGAGLFEFFGEEDAGDVGAEEEEFAAGDFAAADQLIGEGLGDERAGR